MKYEAVIGLEVHVELSTRSKIFCGCAAAFGARPNTNTCPVCTGMPGTLPVLNKQVLEYAIAVGLAVNGTIARHSKFDRKNYFYPDNPQNFQISQMYLPICREGWLDIRTPAGTKKIGILEIHMEEDAGKLIHEEQTGYSLVDYNRAGVPLIEIVSKPHMHNKDEVISYLEQLRLLLIYLGVSDCKMQEGSMRVDVNLSIREIGSNGYGTRTEMKNLNSYKAIGRAIEHESSRQIRLLEAGRAVVQETRRWDDRKETSYSMRGKEEVMDYRYFPDPDLPPIAVSEAWIEKIRKDRPELPEEKRERYKKEYALPDYDIEIITGSKRMADLFEGAAAISKQPKRVSNWLMGETLRIARERGKSPEEINFSPQHLAKLIALTDQNSITSTVAKEVFEVLFDRNIDPEVYVEERGLRTVSDDEDLKKTAREVLREHPRAVQDYLEGTEKAMGFLMGRMMKKTKGKAHPEGILRLLKELLSEENKS